MRGNLGKKNQLSHKARKSFEIKKKERRKRKRGRERERERERELARNWQVIATV
jgi:hypothetical protein